MGWGQLAPDRQSQRSSSGVLGEPRRRLSVSASEQHPPQLEIADRYTVDSAIGRVILNGGARLPAPHIHPREQSAIGEASGPFGTHRLIVATSWDSRRRSPKSVGERIERRPRRQRSERPALETGRSAVRS